MNKLILVVAIAAVAMLTIRPQPVAACGLSKSATYTQHSRQAHHPAAVRAAG